MENWSVEVLKMSNEMRNNLRAVAKMRGETTQEAILNAVSFYIEANLNSFSDEENENKIIIEFDNLMRTHCSTGYLEGQKQRDLINKLANKLSTTPRAVYCAIKESGRSYKHWGNTVRIFLPENDPRLNKAIDVQFEIELAGKIIKSFENYMAIEKKQYIDAEDSEPMKRHIYNHVNPYHLKVLGEPLTERRVNEVLKRIGYCYLYGNKFLRYFVPT